MIRKLILLQIAGLIKLKKMASPISPMLHELLRILLSTVLSFVLLGQVLFDMERKSWEDLRDNKIVHTLLLLLTGRSYAPTQPN